MAMTTYGDISQRTAAWAATEMLSHAEPILVLSKFGQSKPLPKNKADTVKFRRPVPFPVVTAPLQEGVTPTARQMQYEDVTVQIKQWGDVVEITDVVNDLAEDPVLSDATVNCGEQAAETIELQTWGALRAGTNVFYSNGASRSAVNTKISLAKQRAITRNLKGNRAKKVTSMVSASPNYATEPVDAAFIAFAHTDLEADIRDMEGFTPTEKYGSMKALPYEIGKVEDVRYVLSPVLTKWADAGATTSTMVSTTGTNADVYPVVYIGKEFYGLIPLKGKNSIKPSVINPDTKTKDDPLGQRGYVGWKTYFVAKILNEAWGARLEVAASNLA
ncbi:N4-gp56 family major capsid protein [Halomonas sp. McH1-25]|uniref:N4-gp56 family major capsid protein n=1 Tax=unclassified Halomonas TaxID=2609666 RepID=UPI001EF6E8B8|nr:MULTISPECIES: N4-gp56 family major capsid protein [unclassified Halomonas]MCG7598403.1 N4-gp56 family major capsid protein [Halomonas sp. McH1-25]MCP1342655.1 N4-gp56 family major capsid protein [Halomonas sp. FL8]MCP1361718.1 N4-gp56 family major capsid protein [Halomonas sp. BBD45]MCP1363814.1 N4-gp56 family major capsid protein [Halomonas sp. BBD48]